MLRFSSAFVSLVAFAAPLFAAPDFGMSGIYSNEEEVYFDKEAKKQPAPWTSWKIGEQGDRLVAEPLDAFGAAVGKPLTFAMRHSGSNLVMQIGKCEIVYSSADNALTKSAATGKCAGPMIQRIDAHGLILALPDGRTTTLRRARPVTCWAAVRKDKPKADGSPDWFFVKDLKMHDQGGRAWLGKDEAGLSPLTIRMRYVTWAGSASASNRPSLVLYVHRPDEPDSAFSYSWADSRSSRVGINLRLMQASCTVDGLEEPALVNTQNFRG